MGLEYQLCSDHNRRFQRAIDRTSIGEETMDSARGFSVRLLGLQLEDYVDAADHEHIIL